MHHADIAVTLDEIFDGKLSHCSINL
jgi:hypothetical protein